MTNAVLPELVLVHDEPRSYAVCPSCAAHLDLPRLISERWTVRSPHSIAERLQVQMASLEQEEIRVVVMNTKNIVLRVDTVYKGNISAALVRVGELFREAIRVAAAGIILVHNHPSGDPTPSPDDLHLTAEALAAGRLLDIAVLDHIVVARDGWVSLRDRDRGISFDRPGRMTAG